MISFYPEGDRILPSDNEMRTLHKIASLSGAGSGGVPGSGSVGIQQVYIDRDPLAPVDPSKPAINLRSNGDPWTMWVPANQAWS